MNIDIIKSVSFEVLTLSVICFCLNYCCDLLGENLEEMTDDIKMDKDVSGATFLAVSSSIPEFLTSFIAIVFLGRFEDVGFATVAGSGIFNALLIPMFSILAYKGGTIMFDKKVVKRDLGFYFATIMVLSLSMYLGEFSWKTGLVLVLVYITYIYTMIKNHSCKILWNNAKVKNILISLLTLIPIAFFIHTAIDYAMNLSNVLGISGFVVSVIVLAGVTSIPDLFLSIKEAKSGEIESAVSNAIGSNVFDLCMCLGMPLLITGSTIKTNLFDNLGVLLFLLSSVLITGWVLFTGATKSKTIPMGMIYISFIFYISNI